MVVWATTKELVIVVGEPEHALPDAPHGALEGPPSPLLAFAAEEGHPGEVGGIAPAQRGWWDGAVDEDWRRERRGVCSGGRHCCCGCGGCGGFLVVVVTVAFLGGGRTFMGIPIFQA